MSCNVLKALGELPAIPVLHVSPLNSFVDGDGDQQVLSPTVLDEYARLQRAGRQLYNNQSFSAPNEREAINTYRK